MIIVLILKDAKHVEFYIEFKEMVNLVSLKVIEQLIVQLFLTLYMKTLLKILLKLERMRKATL